MPIHTAYKLIVKGIVQGVFFRGTARKEALKLRITGYIKNSDNNSVEIVASGAKDDIDKFVKWCHIGPDNARIDEVKVETVIIDKEFDGFKIIY